MMKLGKKLMTMLLVGCAGLLVVACTQSAVIVTPPVGLDEGMDAVEETTDASRQSRSNGVEFLQAEEVFKWVVMEGNPEYFLVDVRETEDFLEASIEGAIRIPAGVISEDEIIQRLPKDKKIILIDYDGSVSREIASTWEELGFDAAVLVNGMESWNEYPTVKTELSVAAGSGCS
ncbi:MAG: rhodanese-like domain-containing protein [Clostridia bacterium]|jgi:rhodanese-related sulfurtransferase|nr:rhodanese-like domain-containing protein [Clostridia bacterium]